MYTLLNYPLYQANYAKILSSITTGVHKHVFCVQNLVYVLLKITVLLPISKFMSW